MTTGEPDSREELLSEVHRLRALVANLERERSWANGCRGDGPHRVQGLTATETRLLRLLATHGRLTIEQEGHVLYRHVCTLRQKLGDAVRLQTIVEVGYELQEGRDFIRQLLTEEVKLALPAPAKRDAIAVREKVAA
jgi:DNA-binding response OmpR family regulator